MSEGINFIIEYLDEQATCHDDCMCDLCIAKQQAWEAQASASDLQQKLDAAVGLLRRAKGHVKAAYHYKLETEITEFLKETKP